jgi:hypothetical protein
VPRHYIAEKAEHLMRVPDEVRKSVVFLCAKVPTNQGNEIVQAGTGFVLGVPLPDTDRHFVYFVTAKHVIDDIKKYGIDGKVYLRVNLIAGGATNIETPLDLWKFHPTDKSVDVAVLNIVPPQDIFDYLVIPETIYITTSHPNYHRIGCGDEVFISGLFVNHSGKHRNIPIIRTGNIAMMPEEPVSLDSFGDAEVYLIESRSIGGLSGSPVFVHKSMDDMGKLVVGGQRIYLIGLVHGHWDIKPQLSALHQQSINMGIAIVVTMDKIMEVINQPEFENNRKKIIEAIKNNSAPKTDSLLSDNNDDNPITHDEFFNGLGKIVKPASEVEKD